MTQDEEAVREAMDALAQAIRDRDSAAAVATFAADAVGFDLAPPLRQDPAAMHDRSALESWFRTWRGPIDSHAPDLTVAVGGDIAHAHGLQRMTGTKLDGEEVDLWYRSTTCLRREPGGWRITHVHNSVPFAMDGTNRALLDLVP